MVIFVVSIVFTPLEEKTNLSDIKKYVKINIFDTKILDFSQNQKSDEASFIIYVDLKCFIEKIDGCKNDPANSPTTKVRGHIPLGFSMSTISSFKNIENKHTEVKVVWKSFLNL